MSKRFMCGKAAETGIIAAFLARRGFTGPAAILEAPFGGFFSTYMPGENQTGAVAVELGRDFAILQTGFKPYASCLGVHPIIEAALQLRNGGLSAEDVGHIRVITNPQTKIQGSSSDIRTVLDAQLSVVYGVAVSLATGDASIRSYSAERISDPLIHQLMSSVEVLADDTFKGPDAVVEVATRGGHILRAVARTPKGYPQNPMTEPQLIEKFRSLAAYRLLPTEIDQTIQQLARVETLADINELSAPLLSLSS
jgi:2-methylcitrate dehydratase PrpD